MAKVVFRMATEDDPIFTGKFMVSSKKARSSNNGSADGLGEIASNKTAQEKTRNQTLCQKLSDS